VNKTSVESTDQDDDFWAVKRRKRHISNDILQPAKKLTKPVSTSTVVIKVPPKAVLIHNFIEPPKILTWTQRLVENRMLYQSRGSQKII
jgi:hypothetical protein